MDLSFRLDAEGGQGKVAKLGEGEGEEKEEEEGKEAAGRHLGTLTAHHHTPLGDRRQPQGQSSPVERSQVTLEHTQRFLFKAWKGPLQSYSQGEAGLVGLETLLWGMGLPVESPDLGKFPNSEASEPQRPGLPALQ